MQRVAIIGAGTMGRTHCNAYLNIPDAQIVAVCDLDRSKAEGLAVRHGAAVFTSYEEMMSAAEFDILDICLPTYLHCKYALDAMEHGLHVFCEKPIALTEEDALKMIEKAEECNVRFTVGHVLRFFPSYSNAAELCREGRVGVPRLIRTTRNQAFPGWSWQNWYADYEKSGGPFVDLVIHDIDWIIHNFGEVERVYASSFNGKVERQEHGIAILRLKNGTICHVEGSWAYPKGSVFRMTYEIAGTDGDIEYDSVKDAPVWIQSSEDGQYRSDFLNPMSGPVEPYMLELKSFINAVEEGREPLISGQEALSALRVSLAALESSRTGCAVTV